MKAGQNNKYDITKVSGLLQRISKNLAGKTCEITSTDLILGGF
jgi:hypothetical protein